MGGLIPLLLTGTPVPSGNIESSSADAMGPRRSCLVRPASTTPESQHNRQQHPYYMNHDNHPQQMHRRQQSMPSLKQQARRQSLTAPPAATLGTAPVFVPKSAQEWKRVIDEVKRKYVARKYRSCSMQCCEILDSLNLLNLHNLNPNGEPAPLVAVEPLHLIYLHFYAASSFEWCARPLSSSSTYRTKLLRDAQTHYAEAEAHIRAAECALTERARSPSVSSASSIMNRCASPSPSLCSPRLSASSRTSISTTSTSSSSGGFSSAASSPRTSVFSLDEDTYSLVLGPATGTGMGRGMMTMMKSGRAKPKKKVSFSSLPEFFEFQPEPYIRPDSPTLGWSETEEMSRMASNNTMATITEPGGDDGSGAFYPAPLRLNGMNRPSFERQKMTTDAGRNGEYNCDNGSDRCSTPSNHVFDLETFIQTRSINRFCARLSALRDQVSRHRLAVDNLLAPSEPELEKNYINTHTDAHNTGVQTHMHMAAGPSSTPQRGTQPRSQTPVSSNTTSYQDRQIHTSPRRPQKQQNNRTEPSPSSSTLACTPAPITGTIRPSRPALRLKTDLSNTTTTTHTDSGNVVSPLSLSPFSLPLSAFSSTSASASASASASVFTYTPTTTTTAEEGGTEKDGRDPCLRERIERLRANGWRRRRFDSRRYEALREQALGELGAGVGACC
jgi:hypothetical protein